MHKLTLYGEPRGRVIAVMVVYNGMEFLKAGIESTLAELGPDNSLLVVDNDSSDGSFEFVRANYPNVAVLQTHDNLGGAGGFSAGMFTALQVAEAEFIWLLDNDIVVEENALPPLVQCLEGHPDAASAGSQICLYNDPDTIQEVGARYTDWLGDIKGCHRGEKRLTGQPPFQVDYTAACSTLVRKSVVQEIGYFSDLFIFYDDIDWALRAGEAGYSVWAVPESVIRHNFSGLKAIAPWREYYRKRNRAYCLSTHPTQRLGYLALYIYLVFLNYTRLSHQFTGSTMLAIAYNAALSDFLNHKLGKSPRAEVSPGNSSQQSNANSASEQRRTLGKIWEKLAQVASIPLAGLLAIRDLAGHSKQGNSEGAGKLQFQLTAAETTA